RPIIEIALHAIESALDVRGNLAPDLAVIDIGLEACGTVESGRKKRVTAEIDCHIPSSHQSAGSTPGSAGGSLHQNPCCRPTCGLRGNCLTHDPHHRVRH